MLQYFCPLFRSVRLRLSKSFSVSTTKTRSGLLSALPSVLVVNMPSVLTRNPQLFPQFRSSSLPSVPTLCTALCFDLRYLFSPTASPSLLTLFICSHLPHLPLSDPQSPYYPDSQLSNPFCTSALSRVFNAPLRYGHSTPLCFDPPKPPLL